MQGRGHEWLDTRNRLLVRFRPEASGTPSTIALDRAQEPALGADKPFRAPDVRSAKLPNGLEILVVERADLPKVAVSFATRAGGVGDPAGKGGVAHLTVSMIDRGTKAKRALEIEEALGDLGTSLTGRRPRERAARLEVLERNLSPALAVLADVVRIRRSRRRRSSARASGISTRWGSRPRTERGRRARALMLAFGRDHPYGRPSPGCRPRSRGSSATTW